MGRSRCIGWGLIVSLCVASGCGTVSRMRPVSWLPGVGADGKRADAQIAEHNPFGRSDSGDTDRRSGSEQTVRHDAETKQLIHDELADATPAERDRLQSDFRSLDALVVKQVLKLRRMRIELEQQKQQMAYARNDAANEPYYGLGAAYPGAVHPAAVSRYKVAARPDGQDFGHSRSFTDSSRAPVIDARGYGAPHRSQLPGAGRSLDVTRDHATQQQFAGDERRRVGVGNADFIGPQRDRSVISANRQLTGLPARDDSLGDRPTRSQYPVRAAGPTGAAANPLQFTGIDTSPVRRPDGNGMLPAYQQSDEMTAHWSDTLQRLIVTAEEQAYTAQTAWEQADQLSTGNNLDENARRQLIAARQQDFVKKQVYLRMLYLMSGQQARALERVRGLEAADQEFWTQVMWSLANYFDVEGIPNRDDRATQTIVQLRAAIQRLQETAKLAIRNVDFCTKISSFGNYEAFDNNVFHPGQSVMVYGEIENFTSDRGSDGMYRTQLQSTIEIHRVTPRGSEVIETIKFDATTDLCRNHRRDYYHSYELQIPAKATSGSYALVLIVEDQLSKRVATYSRNFTVE